MALFPSFAIRSGTHHPKIMMIVIESMRGAIFSLTLVSALWGYRSHLANGKLWLRVTGSSADKTKSSISNPGFLRTDAHHPLHLSAGSSQPPVLLGRARGQWENTGKETVSFDTEMVTVKKGFGRGQSSMVERMTPYRAWCNSLQTQF